MEHTPTGRSARRVLTALAVTAVGIVTAVAVSGSALADDVQPTITGSQLQGSAALPPDTSITVPDTPFVTDGSSAPFDRAAAVAAGCTYFVTRSLFAAGILENPQWNLDGSHGEIWYLTQRPGTPAATAVAGGCSSRA